MLCVREEVKAVRDDGVAEDALKRRRMVRKLGKYATIRVDPDIYVHDILQK